jgi:hypothetical protein
MSLGAKGLILDQILQAVTKWNRPHLKLQ